mgnify:CR=1 FL=1
MNGIVIMPAFHYKHIEYVTFGYTQKKKCVYSNCVTSLLDGVNWFTPPWCPTNKVSFRSAIIVYKTF